MLSLILQQTSRYVKEYELTEEEYQIINKIVPIEQIEANYTPETIDGVKSFFNNKATKEELMQYFGLWANMLLKHPDVYLQATMNSTYGYFYPNKTEYKDGIAFYKIDTGIAVPESELDLHFYHKTEFLREFIEQGTYCLRQLPIIGLLFSCGLYSWLTILLLLLMIYLSKMKEAVVLVPLLVVILVCIASPVNAFVRYVQPLMISMPFILMWLWIEKQDTRKEENES